MNFENIFVIRFRFTFKNYTSDWTNIGYSLDFVRKRYLQKFKKIRKLIQMRIQKSQLIHSIRKINISPFIYWTIYLFFKINFRRHIYGKSSLSIYLLLLFFFWILFHWKVFQIVIESHFWLGLYVSYTITLCIQNCCFNQLLFFPEER